MKRTLIHLILPAALLIVGICVHISSSARAETPSDDSTRPSNPSYSHTDTRRFELPDSVWKKVLLPDLYKVARHGATEKAFTGKYLNFNARGTYYCAACGNALFRSSAKLDSTSGWASFSETVHPGNVIYRRDTSFGMTRTEVLCARCGAHLGHLFNDGPTTGKRYSINSISLEFLPDQKTE